MTSRRRSSRRMRPNARKRGSRIKGAIPGYGLNDFGEVVVLHGGSHGKPISQSGRGARYVRLERLADRYGRKSFTFEGQTFRKDRSGWHLAGAGAVRPNASGGIPAHYLRRAAKMSWAPNVTVEEGARYLMESARERALMRAAFPRQRTSRKRAR